MKDKSCLFQNTRGRAQYKRFITRRKKYIRKCVKKCLQNSPSLFYLHPFFFLRQIRTNYLLNVY